MKYFICEGRYLNINKICYKIILNYFSNYLLIFFFTFHSIRKKIQKFIKLFINASNLHVFLIREEEIEQGFPFFYNGKSLFRKWCQFFGILNRFFNYSGQENIFIQKQSIILQNVTYLRSNEKHYKIPNHLIVMP